MKRLFIKVFVVFFCFTIVISCTDLYEVGKQVSFAKTQTRDGIDKAWLEQMRLRLLDSNAVYKYSVEDAAHGVSTLYNLLASFGVVEVENQLILLDSISMTISGDSLNSTQMVSLSNFVASHIENYAFQTSPGLVMLDIISSVSGSTAKFKVKAITGDLSLVNLIDGKDMTCNVDAFSGSDCFLSAYGDRDNQNNPIFAPAGPCSNPNTSTSAQEELQQVISKSIPKYVYNNKGIISGEVKYFNIEKGFFLLHDVGIQDFLDNYTNCTSLDIPFNDYNGDITDLRYNGDMLNCAVCALKDYLNSICPSGKVVCHINIFGTISGPNYYKWVVEYAFCNATSVPWESDTNPEFDIDGPGILGSNSILSI